MRRRIRNAAHLFSTPKAVVLLAGVLWRSDSGTQAGGLRGDRFYEGPDGYFQSTSGRRLHRAIWETAHGAIPEGHVIHHLNHDKGDNQVENLQAMPLSEHLSHHQAGKKRNRAHAMCREPDCGRLAHGRQLCGKHYQQEMVRERK